MFRIGLPRPLPRVARLPQVRVRYTSSAPPRPRRTGTILALGAGALGLGLGLYGFNKFKKKVHADASSVSTEDPSFRTLLRTYVVYSLCSIPTLIDSAPWLLDTLSSIPGLRWITQAVVRVTFFEQFVGGDSAAETVPLLKTLRAANTGALFAYSVEVDEAEAMAASTSTSGKESPHKAIVAEMLHCIDVAADFEASLGGAKDTGKRTWVAVKMTALLPDASALIRLSEHIIANRSPTPAPLVVFPGAPAHTDLDVLDPRGRSKSALTADDLASLRALHADLTAICARAAQRGVRVIVDAEYSWYQPAIDAFALDLMRQFNANAKVKEPLVYATFQAYLRRTPAHLVHALRDAEAHGYALGAKLVRGAYHVHEVAAHSPVTSDTDTPIMRDQGRGKKTLSLSISPERLPPVWLTKAETDACYNACAGVLLDAIADDLKRSSSKSSSWSTFLPGGKGEGDGVGIGVLFGTHNWASCKHILNGIHARGLASSIAAPPLDGEEEVRLRVPAQVGERLTFGQLYGMCDDLTAYLARRCQTEGGAPMVIKYVPYGALADVMPYLSRRAIENKTVLGAGAAQKERARAWKGMVGRVWG